MFRQTTLPRPLVHAAPRQKGKNLFTWTYSDTDLNKAYTCTEQQKSEKVTNIFSLVPRLSQLHHLQHAMDGWLVSCSQTLAGCYVRLIDGRKTWNKAEREYKDIIKSTNWGQRKRVCCSKGRTFRHRTSERIACKETNVNNSVNLCFRLVH